MNRSYDNLRLNRPAKISGRASSLAFELLKPLLNLHELWLKTCKSRVGQPFVNHTQGIMIALRTGGAGRRDIGGEQVLRDQVVRVRNHACKAFQLGRLTFSVEKVTLQDLALRWIANIGPGKIVGSRLLTAFHHFRILFQDIKNLGKLAKQHSVQGKERCMNHCLVVLPLHKVRERWQQLRPSQIHGYVEGLQKTR